MTIGEATPPTPAPPVSADNAAGLLLKLIQLLTPLAGMASSEGSGLKIPIEGKIYVPQKARPEALAHHSIRLLPSLQQIQKQVGQMVVALQEGKRGEIKKEELQPSTPRMGSPERAPIATPKSEGKQSFDMNSFSKSQRQSEPSSSLDKPVQKVIAEVKEVIRFLASSTNVASPNKETLRAALEQIQPTLKDVVATIKAQPLLAKMPVLEKAPEAALIKEKPVASQPTERKLAAPVPFALKNHPIPNTPLARTALPQELLPKVTQLGPERLGVPKEAKGEIPLAEPKVLGLAPFQAPFSSLEHRLKKAKRTEKNMSWEEDEPEKEDEEES